MKTIPFASLLLASTLTLNGCISFNSLADARNSRGEGQSKQFAVSKVQAWRQTLDIIEHSNLKLVSEDYSKGLILAQQPISPLSLTVGQNVAVYVSDTGQQTEVEVINKKAVGAIEFVSTDWDEFILDRLEKTLSSPAQ